MTFCVGFKLSVQAITWALQLETGSPTHKLVLLALANYANQDGQCWHSQLTIAADTELSRASIVRSLDFLEKQGVIIRERRSRADGVRTTDIITLDLCCTQLRNSQQRCTQSKPMLQPDTHNNERTVSEPSVKKVKVASRISDNFEPNESCHVLAEKLLLTSKDGQEALENFIDYWKGVPDAKGRKLDWQATFRNQLRYVAKQKGKPNDARTSSRPAKNPSASDTLAAIRDRLGEAELSLDAESSRDGGQNPENVS